MLLRVEVVERDDHALVTATGEIDASTADSVETAVSAELGKGLTRVLLDFTNVTFIDSTGLGVLVRSHRSARTRDAVFAVVHPTPQTLKLIRLLGLDLDQLLHIYDSEEQALTAVR
jgi:anti-sigma B factor antagonist